MTCPTRSHRPAVPGWTRRSGCTSAHRAAPVITGTAARIAMSTAASTTANAGEIQNRGQFVYRMGIMKPEAVERFWGHVNKTDTCWLWVGSTTRGRAPGYGSFGVDGKTTLGHRFSYELHHGPIPDGLVIDHLCRVPGCVNPAHLEAVSNRENCIARGTGPFAEKARATHCKNGHEWTPENTRWRPDSSRGTRNCRACTRDRVRRINAAKRKSLGPFTGGPSCIDPFPEET